MPDSTERRDSGRAPIELRVEYKRFNTFLADYTKNISKGGTFVGTVKPLPVGTDFVFALMVPHLASPLRLNGRVMWTTHPEEASKANPPGMGIEFNYENEEQRREMERLVQGVVAEQLGEHVSGKLFPR